MKYHSTLSSLLSSAFLLLCPLLRLPLLFFSLSVIAAENVNQQSWLGSLRLTVLGSTVDQATSRVDLQTFLYLHNPLFRSLPQAYALMWTLTSGPGGRAYSDQRLSFNNPARPAARTARPFRSRVEVFQGIFSFFSFQGFLFELQKKRDRE